MRLTSQYLLICYNVIEGQLKFHIYLKKPNVRFMYFFQFFWGDNITYLNSLVICPTGMDIGNYQLFVLVRYCYSVLRLWYVLNSVNIDCRDLRPMTIYRYYIHNTHIKDYIHIALVGWVSQSLLYLVTLLSLSKLKRW